MNNRECTCQASSSGEKGGTLQIYLRSSVDSVVQRSARKYPEHQAISFVDREWNYAELDQAIDRVAGHLSSLGISPGDRVAAYGHNSDAYALLFLACARGGFIHVPINYALTGGELSYILNQSGSRVVFADSKLMDQVDAIATEVKLDWKGTLRDNSKERKELDILAMAMDPNAPALPSHDGDDSDLVQLLYTSGTTSAPKGAMLTHRALVHEYVSCIHALDLSEKDRLLHAFPLYHSAQMHAFLMPSLMVGASNWIVEQPEPGSILALLEELQITGFFAPPTFWISLLNHPDLDHRDLSHLERAYYGASIMPLPVIQELRKRLPNIGFYNAFGQTEIAPLATILRPEEHDARPDSAGRPVLFVEMRLVDDDMNDVPPGQPGEVVYRSPQLCTGYWDKPEETAEAFAGGWFHSGDLVVADEEGYIRIVDRKKDVINTGGVLVSSREVEEALYKHPAVQEVAVVAVPDLRWIEAVAAVVVPRQEVTPEELTDFARQHLAPFKVPKQVVLTDELPKNASGKLLKRVLRDRLANNSV